MRTHWRLAIEMCNARWAEGSAIVTTVASRTIISCATAITAKARNRRGSRASGAAEAGSTRADGVVELIGHLRRGSRPIIGTVLPLRLYGMVIPFVNPRCGEAS